MVIKIRVRELRKNATKQQIYRIDLVASRHLVNACLLFCLCNIFLSLLSRSTHRHIIEDKSNKHRAHLLATILNIYMYRCIYKSHVSYSCKISISFRCCWCVCVSWCDFLCMLLFNGRALCCMISFLTEEIMK